MYTWGEATWTDLGLSPQTGDDIKLEDNNFHLPDSKKVIEIACGNGVIAFVKGNGNGVMWTKSEGRGEQHQKRKLKGEVFSWKTIKTSQFGAEVPSPQPLKSLSGIPLAQIAAGGDHSFAVSLSGAVYAWGRNHAGQLGLGNTTDIFCPTLVKSLQRKKTVFISCGEEHTAILTKDGLVYTFGAGSFGQLGHNSTRNEVRPRLVAELWGVKVSQIACGRDIHIVIILLSALFLFCIADGNNLAVDKIVAGGNQTFVLYSQMEELEPSANSFPLKTGKRISSINDNLLDKWISECESKQWKNTKNNDKHFKTTAETLGMDLSLVRLAFEKLARNMKVLMQVESVVLNKLLPSLSGAPAGVEALRIYLIIPELIRVLKTEQSISEVASSLAEAILRLQPSSREILESLWSKIPIAFFKLVVMLYHLVSSRYLHRARAGSPVKDKLENSLRVLQILYKTAAQTHHFGVNNLLVNRRNLLHDTLQYLRNNSCNPCWPLQVKFVDENGIDHGGISQEFFSVITRELHALEPRVFKLYEDSRLVWFTQKEHRNSDMFFLIGVLCGMALYNRCVADFHLPLALFKKLLNEKPTLEDLKELSPIEARSLQAVLDEDEDSVESLYLDFTVQGHELVPNGKDILVTKYNRTQYVEEYVDFVFNKSVKKQFGDFMEGFRKGCPSKMWDIFLPVELMAVLNGNTKYEWEELEKNANYKGYEPTDENIRNFWMVFHELDEERKKNFLDMFEQYAIRRIYCGGDHHFLMCSKCEITGGLQWVLEFLFDLWRCMYKQIVVFLLSRGKALLIPVFLDSYISAALKLLEKLHKVNLKAQHVQYDQFYIAGLTSLVGIQEEYLKWVLNMAGNCFVEHTWFHLIGVTCGLAIYNSTVVDLHFPLALFKKLLGVPPTLGDLKELSLTEGRYVRPAMHRCITNAAYKGEYSLLHPTVKIFWEVFHGFQLEKRKQILLFLTGSDRIPIYGMESLQMVIQPTSAGEQYRPVAHTCYNRLALPKYQTKEILRRRLTQAIEQFEGFSLV
ncbi:putative E3 ubiquitin-protein ligase HERC3 [Acipenser ruthenus]|uniref:Putative E3 ubiquitin-protein ligase HERC3 n=1 Tax=Acipenser ruthenus TaxID=7906 RepID=A0A662Z1C9_ACIRT|nr:putative E3 ubiquitin-protein ligase HERC3 [Acipenser ruthenus]